MSDNILLAWEDLSLGWGRSMPLCSFGQNGVANIANLAA